MDNENFEQSEEMTFYYKKGSFRRLESEQTRKTASGENNPAKGLFKVLVATKGNRMVFFALVLFCALAFILNVLRGNDNQGTYHNSKCTLEAFSFEDKVYVSLMFDPSDTDSMAQVTITAENTDGAVAFEKSDSCSLGQTYRIVIQDYDYRKIICRFDSDLVLSCNIQKR